MKRLARGRDAARHGPRPRPTLPEGIDLLPQIRHIVVLMMENHSYDNYLGMLSGGSILHPALTSVVMPVEDISRRIVSRAVEQIENGPDGDPGVVVPTWVRVGGSTPARDASHLRAR